MTAASAQESLVLKRVFNAPVQTIFEAWTSTEALAQWFGPEGFRVLNVQCDLSVGGQYDITIQAPDNRAIRHFGEYIAIDAPHSLVFTWVLDDQACRGSEDQQATTLVTLLFKEVPTGTLLTLTHEKLPNQAACDGHAFGWQGSFDSLATYLNHA